MPSQPPANRPPLVLILLNRAVAGIKWAWYKSCIVVWVPAHLMALASHRVVLHPSFTASRSFYAVAALPRFILATLWPIIILMLSTAVGVGTWRFTAHDRLPVRLLVTGTASAAHTFMTVLGERQWHKAYYGPLLSASFAVWSDVAAALCGAFTLLGVVRAVPLLRAASTLPLSGQAFFGPMVRRCLVEARRTVVDWSCLLTCGPILTVMPWRLAHMRRNWPTEYADQRRLVVATAFHTLVDLPFVVLSLPVLLTMYRAPGMARELWREADPHKRRQVIVHHCCGVLADLPFIVLGAGVACSVYQLPALIKALLHPSLPNDHPTRTSPAPTRTSPASQRRRMVSLLAEETVLDMLSLLASCFVGITLYRQDTLNQAVAAARAARDQDLRAWQAATVANASFLELPYTSRRAPHLAVLRQAAAVFADLPSRLASVPVYLTLWRARPLHRRLKAVSLDDAAGEIWSQFGLWLTELFTAPFFLAVLATGVHAPSLISHMWRRAASCGAGATVKEQVEHSNDQRAIIMRHFQWLVADMPSAIAALLVAVTGYRVPAALRARKLFLAKHEAARNNAVVTAAQDAATVAAGGICRVIHPVVGGMPSFPAWQCAAAQQAVEVLVDSPYLLCAVINTAAVWRAPVFYKDMYCAATWQLRRQVTVAHCTRALADIPSALACLLVTTLGWRTRRLLRDLQQLTPTPADAKLSSWQRVCWRHLEANLHPMELVASLCVPLSAWRLPSLLRCFKDPVPTGLTEVHYHRSMAGLHAGLALLDLIAAPFAAVVMLTGWRTRTLYTELKAALTQLKAAKPAGSYFTHSRLHADLNLLPYKVVGKQTLLLLRDIPYLASIVVVGVCVPWRLPSLIRKLRNNDSFTSRMAAVGWTGLAVLDVPAAALIVPMCVLWRAPEAWGYLQAHINKAMGGITALPAKFDKPLYQFVAWQLLQLTLDLPFVVMSPLMLWRLPKLWRALFPAQVVDCRVAGSSTSASFTVPQHRTLTGQGTMDGHGLRVHLQTRVPAAVANLKIQQLTLNVVGDTFWNAAASVAPPGVISLVRMTMHPLKLCPAIACAAEFDGENVNATFEFGTGKRGGAKVSHAMLRKVLRALVRAGDPKLVVELRFHAGGRVFNRVTGHMCTFKLSPSLLLANLTYSDSVVLTCKAPTTVATSITSTAGHVRWTILQQVMMAAADVACAGLAVVSSVAVPWRGYILYKQLRGSSTSFHMAVMGNVRRMLWPGLLFEPLAVLASLPSPWRWLRLVRALFTRDDQADQRELRRKRMWKVILGSSADLFMEILAGVVVVTMWRLPSMLYGLYNAAVHNKVPWSDPLVRAAGRRQRRVAGRAAGNATAEPPLTFREVIGYPRTHSRHSQAVQYSQPVAPRFRHKMGAVIMHSFRMVVLDVMQVAEVAYIATTLVQLPHFVARLRRFAALAWRMGRSRRPRPQPRTRRSIGSMPRFLNSQVFSFLDAEGLAVAGSTCRLWRVEAAREDHWRNLFITRYVPDGADVPPLNPLETWREVYMTAANLRRRNQPLTLAQLTRRDYAAGLRVVIHDEFLTSLHRFPHFAMLGFKLVGLALMPVAWLIKKRYDFTVSLNTAELRRQRPWLAKLVFHLCDDHPRRAASRTLMHWSNFDMWHESAWFGLEAIYGTCVHHAAIGVAALNMALLTVLSGGGPLLAAAIGPARAHMYASIGYGIALPALLAFNTYLAFLPLQDTLSLAAGKLSWLGQVLAGPALGIGSYLLSWLTPVTSMATSALTTATSFLPAALTSSVTSAAAPALPLVMAVGGGVWSWVMQPVNALRLALAAPSITTMPISLLPCTPPALSVPIISLKAVTGLLDYLKSGQYPWIGVVGTWALSIVWMYTMGKGLTMLLELAPQADPFLVYNLLGRGIKAVAKAVGRLLRSTYRVLRRIIASFGRGYARILAAATGICRSSGLLGDIALVPVAALWSCWPLPALYLSGLSSSLALPAGGLTLYFIVWARAIIDKAWHS